MELVPFWREAVGKVAQTVEWWTGFRMRIGGICADKEKKKRNWTTLVENKGENIGRFVKVER